MGAIDSERVSECLGASLTPDCSQGRGCTSGKGQLSDDPLGLPSRRGDS